MNRPSSGNDSPFAARTRAPFPGQGSGPAAATGGGAGVLPAPGAPAGANGASANPPKKSAAPLVMGLVAVGLLGGAAWWWFGRGGSEAPGGVAEASQAAPAPAAARRDPVADYAALAKRAAALELDPAERGTVATATMRASNGAHAEAVAELGPLVARRVARDYEQMAVALADVKLEEHPGAAAQQLRLSLRRAAEAEARGEWAAAVVRRDEAIAILPAARAEIAGRFSQVAKEAVQRGDLEMATYFFERALRLDATNAEARAHLFAHKFAAGQVLRAPSGIAFAYVPPGEFLRGSRAAEPGRGSDEEQGRVRLTEGVFMGVTEVTQRQWDLAFGPGAAARHLAAAKADAATIGPDLPMHSVRWDEAVEFCQKLSERDGREYRLPTEAEWEYACRAGTTSAFNLGGDGLSARDANIDDGSAEARFALAPAGTVGAANAWGLRDMHGNVWEWCADWSAPYPSGDLTDPRGPDEAQVGRLDLAMRVVRGGGWNAPASDARSANRWEYSPAVGTAYIGLRLAMRPELTTP